eukprot:CAMPEP_0175939010 /NCGR_PEP_ID=MMETSP0108-20121206/23017_1 /TAXON_ID=195067 ORGANISM="Goniomonas pacifica, Strain CCMP1869" /NCGR_SAMPLE_ID=MMETSP0108 /ASSEMBLY_ACC=CAM_ASM_000204 /LENGTH=166 /DNA_ID=CAMNT_0017263331 /DNA_START=137 /DNA_END=638 /DNA_ORIENTATION=-
MVANTGTYVDTPFHRFADGADLAGVSLDSLADIPGVCIDARGQRAIGPSTFSGVETAGKAVLVWTGHAAHWRTDAYFEDAPFLSREACEFLLRPESRPTLVGIDSFNIDDVSDGSRPAHTLFLGAGIPICEHMTNLEALPRGSFQFFAVPPKIQGFGTFPVERLHE